MRAGLIGTALAGCVALTVRAAAQSPLDGPLASPDAVLAPPAHPKKVKPKKSHHAVAKPTADGAGAIPPADRVPTAASVPARPVPSAPSGGAGDPLSLGMKWNGNNDSAAETRSQNLDGNAFGTGAEVGMKLHF